MNSNQNKSSKVRCLLAWFGQSVVLFSISLIIAGCSEQPYDGHPLVGKWRAVEFPFSNKENDSGWTEIYKSSGRCEMISDFNGEPMKESGGFEISGDVVTLVGDPNQIVIDSQIRFIFEVDGDTLATTKDFDALRRTPTIVKYERVSD